MVRNCCIAVLMLIAMLVAPGFVSAEDVQVFRGDYSWNVDGHRNQVEAVFTPTGEGAWDVVFEFKYARRQGRYSGKAEGVLQDGTIAGDVKDNHDILRYRFEAEVKGDRLEGRHYDIWEGRKKWTGTLTLERVKGDADPPSDQDIRKD